jgi:hypothetical protein
LVIIARCRVQRIREHMANMAWDFKYSFLWPTISGYALPCPGKGKVLYAIWKA